MKKAKATSKATAKKAAKKRTRKVKKDVDLAEVRKDITKIVGSEANKMAQAVVGEALKGQLAPVKYLFEVSGLYPATPETAGKGEADSLANLLLKQLNLQPETAAASDDETAAASTNDEGAGEADESKSAIKPAEEISADTEALDAAAVVVP